MKRTWAFILMVLALAGWGWHGALAAPPAQADVAMIISPQNNAVVRGRVSIVGTALHPQFQFYKVEYAREPAAGDQSYAIIGAIRNQQVTNGELEVWDTTRLADGSYTLRLRVVRLDGNYSEFVVQHVVVANAQPEQPTATPTPAEPPTPTITPTPLPPTPTIVIEQPAAPGGQPTPPVITRTPLPTPVPQGGTFHLDTTPLQTACLYGAGGAFGIFLLFGFLAALRNLVYAVLGRRER